MKWIAVMSAAALLFAGGCKPEKNEAPETRNKAASTNAVQMSAAQIQHGGVKWAPVESRQMVPAVELPGELVPNEDHTAHVGATSEGRVLRVNTNVGDRVSRGHALVVLQSANASAARADLVKAQSDVNSRRAALVYARSARERAERLLNAKAGSRQDVDRTRADEELAQSALTAAEAELSRARATLQQLGVSAPNGEMVIRSPIAGVVLTRDVVPGAVVQPGAPLVSVSDIRTLWLKVAASDAVANTIRPNQQVRFTVAALPAETFQARVNSIGGSLDPHTRTLPVRATVDNASGKLRPNMFATVQLDAGAVTSAMAVPDTAIVLVDEKPVVFVARPAADGGATFERRSVQLGNKSGERTLVIGGIHPGDDVVIDGAFAVKSLFERAKMPAE